MELPRSWETGVGTSRIRHGQRITVDGDAGTVTLHESSQTLDTIPPADVPDGI